MVPISRTGSELPCRGSAGAAEASSLALTCKATIGNVEHESEVHVSVILLSILLFLFVTVLLSLALLLLLRLGVLCSANTRNCSCLTVPCQKTDRCHPCPISCQRNFPLKATVGKATSPLCSTAVVRLPLPADPTVCTASTGSATVAGSCSRSWLLSIARRQAPAAAGADSHPHHHAAHTLPRLRARHLPCFGDPSHHFSPQSLPASHLV